MLGKLRYALRTSLGQRAQIGALVGKRVELIVDKNTVALAHRLSLQGQSDKAAEVSQAHGILQRKEPVIGTKAHGGAEIACLRHEALACASRKRRLYGPVKKDPYVRAFARARPFDCRRQTIAATDIAIR
ncbi:MAG: hypothetical protein Q4B54_14160, partial [Coriobacteriales bacterium]|nr:hypothetical protein [Coriobacteriales bacterium]